MEQVIFRKYASVWIRDPAIIQGISTSNTIPIVNRFCFSRINIRSEKPPGGLGYFVVSLCQKRKGSIFALPKFENLEEIFSTVPLKKRPSLTKHLFFGPQTRIDFLCPGKTGFLILSPTENERRRSV